MKDRLSTVSKICYGFGDFGCNMSNGLIASFFLIYCTDTFGIGAGVVGTIVLLGRFWDMINDTWVGSWTDRTNTPKGKYLPWIKAGILPLALVTILLFWSHPDWSPMAKNVYVFVLYFAWAFAFTIVNIPYTALTAVMSQDPGERASCASWRMTLSNLAMMVTGSLVMPLIGTLGKGNNVNGWLYTAILLCVVGCITIFICAAVTKERVKAPASVALQKTPILSNVKYALHNKWFLIDALGMFLMGFTNLGRMSVMTYFFMYVYKDMAAMSIFVIVQSLGGILGAFFSEYVVRALKSKGKTICIFSIGIILFLAVCYTQRDGGPLFLVTAFAAQFCIMSALSAVFASIPDCVEYGLLKDGVRMDGFYSAFGYFWHKAGIALGSAGAGWILALTDYIPNSPQQPASAITGINFMFFFLPMILAVIQIVAFSFYKLDFKMFDGILKEIDQKYSEEQS
mgnify:CR=1 FL=1